MNEDEMSTSELAAQFGVPVPAEKQETNNDIYKISARVKNLARGSGASLTPVGDILCNTYTHVLFALYEYSSKLPEPHKTELFNLIQKHEGMPADVIAAAGAGIKRK